MADGRDELIVADARAWRTWLAKHHSKSDGVWLVIAKKGTTSPTSLAIADALDEALCQGWIDGVRHARDDTTFIQRFTPRRARSIWSKRNIGHVARLVAAGRMRAAGRAEVERAKADGRWDAAYGGSADMEPSPELLAALDANLRAKAMFEILTSQNRFAILFRIAQAKKPETKTRRIEQFVAQLARGETIHPQKRSLES